MAIVNDPPIEPITPEWGDFAPLCKVSVLAACLLRHWPDGNESEAYVTALMVCDAVLAGSDEDTAEHARAAFIDAVHEAGLSVSPDDGGPD